MTAEEVIIEHIEKGKRRGYDDNRTEDGIEYLYRYSINKRGKEYVALFRKVEYEHIDNFEDYQTEIVEIFNNISDAIQFIKDKGGNLSMFKGFKG